jgi:predicted CoA-binding protein
VSAITRSRRELIDEAVNSRVWAVAGASEDMSKWGSRIYRALKQSGYKVYPVNPDAPTADGDPTYPTLLDLPETPAVVDVVVPRWVGRRVATDAAQAGVRIFWLQPGAEGRELIEYAESLGLDVIYHACALTERRTWDEPLPTTHANGAVESAAPS